MEKVLEYFVEPAQAIEAGSERHFGHRHLRFVDQMFSEEYAAGLRNRNGRCSEMLQKKPAQLPFANAKPFRERVYIFAITVESAVRDERQRA